jgi:leucyl aminopeptidase
MDVTDFVDRAEPPTFMAPFAIYAKDRFDQDEEVNRLMAELSPDNLHDTVAKLSSWRNRYYSSDTGVEAADWIRDQFEALAKGRSDVKVQLFKHKWKQPSVIARIEGRSKPEEVVIIGAHEDSIKGWGSVEGEAPGADDDASGVATVLEVFRVLMESDFQPERTIEFMTYAAEEKGLLGSQDIAREYQDQRVEVVGALQFDMTMYKNKSPAIHLVTDYTDADLTEYTRKLIDTYVKFPWKNIKCGYACSDHASWNRAKYASAFPFEAPMGEDNPKIHTPGDTLDNDLDMEFGLHFAKLGVAFAVEMTK